jgi:hypothetical protein
MRNVRVKIGDLAIPLRAVKPPELVMIKLDQEKIKRIGRRDKLVISIREAR